MAEGAAIWLGAVYAGFLGLAGLLTGSFLNVVVHRAPLGLGLAEPPSRCPKCGRRIAARDNLPVVSWLLLGGRCRNCRLPISLRYPAVELVTGLLWAWEGWRLAGLRQGYWTDIGAGVLELTFLSSLVATFLIDWDHRIILDEISLGGLAAALLFSPWTPAGCQAAGLESLARDPGYLIRLLAEAPPWVTSLAASLAGGAAGLGLSLGVYFLGNALFRRQIEEARKEDPGVDSALGLGDVKLMAFFGAFLGWRSALGVFFIASLTGSLAGSALKIHSGSPGGASGWRGLVNRWRSGDSVIPLGPFLTLGALVCFFFDPAQLFQR